MRVVKIHEYSLTRAWDITYLILEKQGIQIIRLNGTAQAFVFYNLLLLKVLKIGDCSALPKLEVLFCDLASLALLSLVFEADWNASIYDSKNYDYS